MATIHEVRLVEELVKTNINHAMPWSPYTNGNEVYAASPDFWFRFAVWRDTVDIGIAKHFDRWANSCDFHTKVPKNQRDWDRMIRRLKEEMERENYSAGGGLGIWL